MPVRCGRLRLALVGTLPAALIAAASSPARAQGFAPDAVYVGGTVLTMDAKGSTAEAVAVRGDEIIAVGRRADIERLAGSGTRTIDLHGKVLAPGFYAAHDHFPGSGIDSLYRVNLNSPPMGPIRSIDDLVEALRQAAAHLPPGAWVVGRGYDDTLLRDKRHPTRYDLDRASTTHPIWIVHTSGHLGVANSKALEIAGITKSTPQPKSGVIRRDPKTGEPTGIFEESGGLVSRHIPSLTREQRLAGMKVAVEDYVSHGVTTTVIASGNRRSIEDLQIAERQGILKMRVITMSLKSSPRQLTAAEAGGILTGFGDTRLKLGAIKILQDGSIQGYTGYLTKPYYTPFNGDSTYRGYAHRSREDLTTMVTTLHCAGYQIAIHANGDAAIDDVLAAYASAHQKCPRPDARDRIEHVQMARQDQLDRMRELGITPSFFEAHVYYWGDRHRDIFIGPERAAAISPLRSALRRGLRFTLHNDTPVTPVNPLLLVWAAVNRRTMSGQVLGPDERITPLEALRAVTSDAAWQNFEERIKGSIEPGKLADFVILSENPLTVDPARIRDIQVLETIVGNATVYRKP
jgi:predicted amidohydrolase YtcJ